MRIMLNSLSCCVYIHFVLSYCLESHQICQPFLKESLVDAHEFCGKCLQMEDGLAT